MLLTVAQSVYSLNIQSQVYYVKRAAWNIKYMPLHRKKRSQLILLALPQHSLGPQTQFSWLPISNLFKSLRTVQQ